MLVAGIRQTRREDYDLAFETECAHEYRGMDAFENLMGFRIDRLRLERAARVLACPVKKNPPCWQHGRVLYAAARKWLWEHGIGDIYFLDIGTAKGFSALMMQYAANDAGRLVDIVSVDVIDPDARVYRNTVAETVDGPITLRETLEPFPASRSIRFVQCTGEAWLRAAHIGRDRPAFAFIDGKHTQAAVETELGLLAEYQHRGDMVVLDDIQIPGVAAALAGFRHRYQWDAVSASENGPARIYAVARRM